MSSTCGAHQTPPDAPSPEHDPRFPLRGVTEGSGYVSTGPARHPLDSRGPGPRDPGPPVWLVGLGARCGPSVGSLAACLAGGRGQDQHGRDEDGQGDEHQLPAIVRRGSVGRCERVGGRRGDTLVGGTGRAVDLAARGRCGWRGRSPRRGSAWGRCGWPGCSPRTGGEARGLDRSGLRLDRGGCGLGGRRRGLDRSGCGLSAADSVSNRGGCGLDRSRLRSTARCRRRCGSG